MAAAEALFSGAGDLSHMPTVTLTSEEAEKTGLHVTELLVMGKLASSKSDARRLIESKSVSVGEELVSDVYAVLTHEQVSGEGVILRKGKKGFCRIRLS